MYEGSKSWSQAEAAGLKVATAAEAAKAADIIMILVPDEKQADIYNNSIKPYLTEGKYLLLHMDSIYIISKLYHHRMLTLS